MSNALLVSSNDKGTDMLVQLLKAEEAPKISTVSNGAEARRIIISNEYDLIIINTPLIDEFGHELAIKITDQTTSAVVMIVKSEICEQVMAKVEDYGVLLVTKPLNKMMFYQTLKLANATRKRILGFKSENVRLAQKIDEIRLIDRAKCVLIQYLNLTEQQAHRHIEKQAMDMRVTRTEVAQGILKTYET